MEMEGIENSFERILVGGRNMQQHPVRRETSSLRARRTNPALPGATLPTVPSSAQPAQQAARQPVTRSRLGSAGRTALWLCGIGVPLELLTLALYPVLANTSSFTPRGSVTTRALTGLFPWISHLYWQPSWPPLVWFFAHVQWCNPATASGSANLFVLLVGLAFVLSLCAAHLGRRVARQRLERAGVQLLFGVALCFTLLFGLTYLFAPGGTTQNMFLYGLYGRMVTIYHVNPYIVSLASFPRDIMQQGLARGIGGTSPFAPAWLDFSIPVTLIARNSIASVLLGFRTLGLLAHVLNSVLIWLLLAKLRPQRRFAATLLYGWNPLVLLVSVTDMHLEVVALLLLLCAALFFQRNLPFLAWAFVLLSVLTNLFCLLLVPLFFRLLAKDIRTIAMGRRFLSWLLALVITILLIFLAYVPYWPDWGIQGLGASFQHTFLQDSAINSLDAALLNLPVRLPAFVAWLAQPHHWTILAAIAVACFLLLGLWLSDALAFLLLFSGMIFLSLLLLLPAYWPAYVLIPLALVLCSGSWRTILLAVLLTAGAYLSYYFSLWQPVWPEQGLVTIGLPLLIWGWTLFFISTWELFYASNQNTTQQSSPSRRGFSGFSRPSLPSRQGRREY